MICPKCGSEIKDGAKFCKYCGALVDSTIKTVTEAGKNTLENDPVVVNETSSPNTVLITSDIAETEINSETTKIEETLKEEKQPQAKPEKNNAPNGKGKIVVIVCLLLALLVTGVSLGIKIIPNIKSANQYKGVYSSKMIDSELGKVFVDSDNTWGFYNDLQSILSDNTNDADFSKMDEALKAIGMSKEDHVGIVMGTWQSGDGDKLYFDYDSIDFNSFFSADADNYNYSALKLMALGFTSPITASYDKKANIMTWSPSIEGGSSISFKKDSSNIPKILTEKSLAEILSSINSSVDSSEIEPKEKSNHNDTGKTEEKDSYSNTNSQYLSEDETKEYLLNYFKQNSGIKDSTADSTFHWNIMKSSLDEYDYEVVYEGGYFGIVYMAECSYLPDTGEVKYSVQIDNRNTYSPSINYEDYYGDDFDDYSNYSLGSLQLLEDLNIRTGPGSNYENTGLLKKGTSVEYYDFVSTGDLTWFNIGQDQWIATDGTWIDVLSGPGTSVMPETSNDNTGRTNQNDSVNDAVGYYVNDSFYADISASELESGLEYFYSKTGVKPFIYFTSNLPSGYGTITEVAKAAYSQFIGTEYGNHLLLAWYETESDDYYADFWIGGKAQATIGRNEIDILKKNIVSCYSNEEVYKTYGQLFSAAFRISADEF